MIASLPFSVSLLASLAAAQSCSIVFDGRVDADLAALDFDVPNNIFSNEFVLGNGLSLSSSSLSR